jgi:hypothetical protein
MTHPSPAVTHPHRTSWFVGAAAIGAVTSPFAAVYTVVLGLAVALVAGLLARGRVDGAAGAVMVVAAGLVAGVLPYFALALFQAG